jgi:hypothetical protein
MSRCTIRDVAPTPFHAVLPAAVPVSRARDPLDVSGTSPIPGHRQAGALGRVPSDLVRGREWLAFHPRTSQRTARARGRRCIQGGSARQRADPRELPAGLATQPGGLAGAVAAIPATDARALWKPAQQAGQQPPGERRWRARARPLGLIPCWATLPGDPQRERPGPDRTRPRAQPRQHAPRRSPPIRRLTVGRAHAVAMPSLTDDVGARTCCHRVIARQEHRARRDDMVQERRDPQASQRPAGPSAL